jgi:hypothetical protein
MHSLWPRPAHLTVADDPAEAASGDQHEVDAVVEGEVQRFGHAVICMLADGIEAESFAPCAFHRPSSAHPAPLPRRG